MTIGCMLMAALVLMGSPSAALTPTALQGPWIIARSSAPDWIRSPGQQRANLVGRRVSFEDGTVDAPAPIGCGHARYSLVESPPQGLFQGYLEAPDSAANAARELHLSVISTPTVRVDCDTGSFDYHVDERGELVIMLDQVLYHLTRVGNPAQP